MRYILFAGEQFTENRGVGDIVAVSNDLAEVREKAKAWRTPSTHEFGTWQYDYWSHILDTETGAILDDYEGDRLRDTEDDENPGRAW